MVRKFVSTRTTVFDPDSAADSQFVLIYGDEVDSTGQISNGFEAVTYRGRQGRVRSNRLMNQHPLEIYFIDVGQGDSTFIVTPNERKILIDGGSGHEAFQFLVWKYRLDLPTANPVDIDLLILSHTDDDHIGGLAAIVEHPLIHVKEVLHSGIAKFASGHNTELGTVVGQGSNRLLTTRHDGIADLAGAQLNTAMRAWRQAIVNEAPITYRAVDNATGSVNVGDPDVSLTVLAPRLSAHNGAPAYRWLDSESKTVNAHSVIARLDFQRLRVLFPGDVNDLGARHLLAQPGFALGLNAHVLKAPHHGSHEFDLEFLESVNPQVSVISSGESPDHGHPRANFLGAIGHASRTNQPLVFSTALAAHFAVDADAAAPDADDDPDPTDPAMLGQARRRFKKRLNGLINVRSDGDRIFCARRVATSYQFVTDELSIAPP